MNHLLPLPHFSVFRNVMRLIAYAIIGEESWRGCLGPQTTKARQPQRGLVPLGDTFYSSVYKHLLEKSLCIRWHYYFPLLCSAVLL
jgi:hypothetical protein